MEVFSRSYLKWVVEMQGELFDSFARRISVVPLDFLKIAYHGLHDLDLNLAVAKVAGGDRP